LAGLPWDRCPPWDKFIPKIVSPGATARNIQPYSLACRSAAGHWHDRLQKAVYNVQSPTFHNVDKFTTAIVTFPRIALGIFICHDRALRFQYRPLTKFSDAISSIFPACRRVSRSMAWLTFGSTFLKKTMGIVLSFSIVFHNPHSPIVTFRLFAQGIIRLTLQTSSRLVGIRF